MASKNKEAFRESDSRFILKSLNYATTPIVINCTPLAAEEDAKIGTVQKRINVMAKRWNLPISTTTTTKGNSAPATPAKSPGVTGGRKRKSPATKTKKGSENEEANSGDKRNIAKKQKTADSETDQDGSGAAETDEGESASEGPA